MPSVSAALLAMTLHRPITDTGVWLENPPPNGTVVTAPVTIEGETQAPEGVLSIRLYVVQGATVTELAAHTPVVPVGTVPFEFTWAPKAPGTYTVRVVSTTAVRGFSAEVTGLVVPGPAQPRAPRPAVQAPRTGAPPAVAARPAARRAGVVRRLDDSGRAFGRSAPTLPYTAPVVVSRSNDVRAGDTAVALPAGRRGWLSVAGGLLLLLVCSHLHRSLRPQPVPRGTR